MPEKQTNKQRLKEITDSIEAGIKELFDSEKYRKYLSVMSRFHRYSVNNTMLIFMQKPDATLVAGYHKWIDQFQRHVKKGEHGITIIAPTPYKKTIEAQKLDPDTKAPILDKDGKIVTEEKEIQIPMFRPIKVFDVSQTEGKPLPQLAASLSGSVEHFDVFMEALKRAAPVPLTLEPLAPNLDGYFSPKDRKIVLREGMSQVQTISAAVHEVTHSMLHDYEKQGTDEEPAQHKGRNTEEVEAESVSYAVCQYYGIETADNSFGYIASWSQNRTLPELKASLETINQTAGKLISAIDANVQIICRERGIVLSQEADTPARLAEDLDAFSFNFDPHEYHDRVSDREAARQALEDQLKAGQVQDIQQWLQETVQDADPQYREKAQNLLNRLAAMVPKQSEQYQVVENNRSHNELDRSIVKAPDGQILGAARTERCQQYAEALNNGEMTPQAVKEEMSRELQKWHCYIIPDLMTWNAQASQQKLVGRIDYLGFDGTVREGIDYTDPEQFRLDLEAETYAGVPFKAVLYKDEEHRTIPHEFLYRLDPPPKGITVEQAPVQERKERTPIEFFDTYEQAAQRFQQLRRESYNSEPTMNPQNYQFYARLTFGIQRENPPGAADLIHVRNGKNYLVDDFTRMKALNESEEVMDILHRLHEDMGFDRIIRHDQDSTGKYLPPLDLPFEAWNNPYFGTDSPEQHPEAPEQHLDEYPMPAPSLTEEDLEKYSFADENLIPVSRERAAELMEQDLTIYVLREGNGLQMAFDQEDLEDPSCLFAVSREEWEQSPAFQQTAADRMDSQKEREQAFLHSDKDCFAIFQVKRDDPDKVRFLSMAQLKKLDVPVMRENYDLVYTAPLTANGSRETILDELYRRFNTEHPADYSGASVSVSDILAIRQHGVVTCHYVDSIGFQPVQGFLEDNPLKTTEMTVEDDYGMIDGIINNGPKEQPRQEERKSIVEQLRTTAHKSHRKDTPKREKGREL